MIRHQHDPWPWGAAFALSQAVRVEGARELVFLSGQASIDAEANPLNPGDMKGQLEVTLANIRTVLAAAGMDLSHVVQLRYLVVDVDAFMKHSGIISAAFHAAGVAPAATLLGVTRLFLPELLVEIEVVAAR
jgi:enamine deaminase RidA (YjgF/YER057c/UK114 family)